MSENLLRFVDNLINKIPPTLTSFIKDANHFLSDIADLNIPHGFLFVTLDVASLYTNLPHADGIKAVNRFLDDDNPIDSSAVSTMLKLILELNNFQFCGEHYVKVSGTSMGTIIGPNYTNILMGVLEDEFLADRSRKPFYHKRFINDLFLIWQFKKYELLKNMS